MSCLISVVICTYNRADLLANLLPTVCQQSVERSQYEVIIVDNNSTDNTSVVSDSFVAHNDNVRYCFEPQQGLSHARNRGWQEAKGQYVAYLDDDCKVPEQWLEVAADVIHRISPSVFGGPYFAFYNVKKPPWYKDRYGSYEPYTQAMRLEEPEKLHGGNLFLERKVLEESAGFDPQLGMSGGKMAYGEETGLLQHLDATIPNLLAYYEPNLFVYHLVRPEKMKIGWIIRHRFVNARYVYRVSEEVPTMGQIRLILYLFYFSLRLMFSCTLGFFIWRREEYKYLQNYWYERTFEHLFPLGWFYEQYQQVSKKSASYR